jgi:hypothetical protein
MRSQTVSILEGNTFVVSDLRGDVDQYFLVPGTGTVYSDANWSLIRKRSVGDGAVQISGDLALAERVLRALF